MTLIQSDGGTDHSSSPIDQDIPSTDPDSSSTHQDRPSEDQDNTTIVHQDTADEDRIETLPPIPRVSQVHVLHDCAHTSYKPCHCLSHRL